MRRPAVDTDISVMFSTTDVTTLPNVELNTLLKQLEEEEQRASKRRASLHDRIEFVHASGAISADQLATLQKQERELSERRRFLHSRIDELRAERSRRLASVPRA